jgi:hypothetical protein
LKRNVSTEFAAPVAAAGCTVIGSGGGSVAYQSEAPTTSWLHRDPHALEQRRLARRLRASLAAASRRARAQKRMAVIGAWAAEGDNIVKRTR